MRALYSLVSHARTVCALGQTVVTFVRAGPAGLTLVQVLLLACGLCLLIRVLAPSPSAGGGKGAVFLDRLCSGLAAGAVVGLIVMDAVGSCILLGGLTLGC